MKSRAASLIAVGIMTVVLSYAGIRSAFRNETSQEIANRQRQEFESGTLPPIAPPYLEPGDPDELSFSIVDLSPFAIRRISENGTIALVQGATVKGSPKSWATYSPREGIKTVPDVSRIHVNARGDTFTFKNPDKSDDSILIQGPNITSQPANQEQVRTARQTFTSQGQVGSQGFTFTPQSYTNPFTYFDFGFKQVRIPIRRNSTFTVLAQSSLLGDVGIHNISGNKSQSRLGFLKNRKFFSEEIPVQHEYLDVRGSKYKVGINAGRSSYERIPYLRVSEKNYERVPVPEGAISAEILAMNSNDQYIMRIYRPNLIKKAPAVLLDSETYYVSTYKYYPLKDIEARFFRKRPDGRCAISEWLFDENGDLVAHQPEGSHLLIQPAPHIVKHINFENASE